MRFIVFASLLAFTCCFKAEAQHDSLSSPNKTILNPVDPKTVNPFLPDSVVKANRQELIADSIAMSYLIPDSSRMKNHALDSILKITGNTPIFQGVMTVKRSVTGESGKIRRARDAWIVAVVIGLLIYVALLNLFFGSDLKNILQSFYNKRSHAQTDKEAGLINSWAFVGLILLFCLTLGLVLYQLLQYYHNVPLYGVKGVQLFILLAAVTGLLIALKFILLKFLGFIFDIAGVVSEYLAVLNLTYFSLAFVLLAVAVCFSLLANQFMPQLLAVSLGLTVVIFVWQYLRSSLNIISDFRFHKFYLFVYLCALEICPVLILIKALNI